MNGRDVRFSDGTPTYSYDEIGLDAPLCHAVIMSYGHSSVQAWGTMSKMSVCIHFTPSNHTNNVGSWYAYSWAIISVDGRVGLERYLPIYFDNGVLQYIIILS